MSWFDYEETRIYFEEEGTGDPVLFLPGWSESIDEFQDLRRALARDFRVIAADLPGSGKSGPQPRHYSNTYYHDDARAFAALLQSRGLAPAHITGFSDGGETALVMAIVAPASVRSLVAWGAMGEAPAEGVIDMFRGLIDSPIEPMREFSAHLKSVYGEGNARLMTRSAAAAWTSMAAREGGSISRSRAAEIACPVLLITGEQDFLAPPPAVSSLASAIPDARFEEVKGAGHVLHVDHSNWLAETITAFLRETAVMPPGTR